jgi:peptidoglycan/LPS O-acetylase OafA/YrhL
MIVVLVPRRYLLACITFFIIIAPLYRVAMYGPGMNLFFNFLLPGAMDSLATGALIAYAVNFVPQATPWKKFIEMRTALLLLSLGAIAVVQTMGDDGFQRVFQRCFVDIFSACLVSIAIEPAIDWRFNWLGNKTIRHFGKISYGLYVYHYFLPHIIDAHWNFDWIGNHAAARLARFAVLVSLAVAIAEMSWHFVEKPIMRLKDRISFGNDRPVVARESS